LSKGAPTHAQHQDLVAIGGLGLIEDQRDRLAAFRQPRQNLAGERLHDLVAAHQIVGQEPRNPLIADVPAIGLARQAGRRLDQIGAAHVQHVDGETYSHRATSRLYASSSFDARGGGLLFA
jgi:hypothetical protein